MGVSTILPSSRAPPVVWLQKPRMRWRTWSVLSKIQTLSPRGSDPALGERVRPRRLYRCPELSHPESSQAPIKRFAIPAVPVTEEIPWRIPIPATGVHDLLGSPVGGGMSGHPNLQDLPSLVVQHEEDVQRF